MSRSYRTAAGGRVDRSTSLAFTFDGRRYTGFAGDTLASALLANGVHLVARSFKYHRPRGIMTAGSEEPNALLRIGEGGRALPNTRATQVELYDGLIATSQNSWPSLARDAGAVADLVSPLLPAGFYYKTFKRPKFLWGRYEALIRRAAGMGRTPELPDPDVYDKRHAHCDLLIVGAGPTGLAAALAAGRTGARVILMDEQGEFGGQLLGEPTQIDGAPAASWIEAALAELSANQEIRLLRRTTAFGYYDHNFIAAIERVADHLAAASPGQPRQRLWKIRAKQVILATGAHERPLVFADNDRPGIMLAGAARTYLNRYGVRIGDRIAIFTNNDSAYPLAAEIAAAGGDVAVLVDLRPRSPDDPAVKQLAALHIEVLSAHAVVATKGRRRLRSIEVMPLDGPGQAVTGTPRQIVCDALAMSGGWVPAVHLFSQAQGSLRYEEALAALVPDEARQPVHCAGAARGVFGLADCLADGFEAGRAAAADAGFRKSDRPVVVPLADNETQGRLRVLPAVPSERSASKYFVDFQNDVTAADIGLAIQEGYVSVEHLKRYTTTGMGTDQGKTSNLNALVLMSARLETSVPAIGTTTFRPPYTPVTFGALAGRDIGALYQPIRRTPMQSWHEAQGAMFEDVGLWRRPFYYPRRGESKADAVKREVLAVRQGVGLLDASTLGTIDIRGPDAVALLNWVYTNYWNTLEVGRCRYGVMCREDGMVLDDGVTARLDERHFLMHTTSSNAERVLAWIEEWLQTEWPELRVHCASVTDQFATVAVAGPMARRLLAEISEDIDLDPAAFPFMAVREGTVAGMPARVFRISYTGELSYEVNVPAGYGMALWQALLTVGARYGVTPFGTEAMHVLRAEKGYILVGQETDGTVTPADLGMEWAISKRKDFLGKRSLSRADMLDPDRKQLVGLLTEDPKEVLPEGAHIVEKALPEPPMTAIGHVTSSYFSPILDRSIALALIRGGRARHGQKLPVPMEDGRIVTVTIASPVFYDPEGARLHA